jgi:uncharacterized membrane protein
MKKTLVRWKIYTDRARWYVAYVQFLMMVIVVFQTRGVLLDWWLIILLIPVVVIAFIVIGFIDVKIFKLLEAEQQKYAEENPTLQQILKEVKK